MTIVAHHSSRVNSNNSSTVHWFPHQFDECAMIADKTKKITAGISYFIYDLCTVGISYTKIKNSINVYIMLALRSSSKWEY